MDFLISSSAGPQTPNMAFENGWLSQALLAPSDVNGYNKVLVPFSDIPIQPKRTLPPILFHAMTGSIANHGSISDFTLDAGSVIALNGFRIMQDIKAQLGDNISYWYISGISPIILDIATAPDTTDSSGGAVVMQGSGTILKMANTKSIDPALWLDLSVSDDGIVTFKRATKIFKEFKFPIGIQHKIVTLKSQPNALALGWNEIRFSLEGSTGSLFVNDYLMDYIDLDDNAIIPDPQEEGPREWSQLPVPNIIAQTDIFEKVITVVQSGERMQIGLWAGKMLAANYSNSSGENVLDIPLSSSWLSPILTFSKRNVLKRVEIVGHFFHDHNCTLDFTATEDADWTVVQNGQVSFPAHNAKMESNRLWLYPSDRIFGTSWRFRADLSINTQAKYPRRIPQLAAIKLQFREM